MSPEQKVLLRQFQLAGMGIIFAIVGLLTKRMELIWIGVGVFLFGLARGYFLYKIIKQAEDE